jgi:hypothetical protein
MSGALVLCGAAAIEMVVTGKGALKKSHSIDELVEIVNAGVGWQGWRFMQKTVCV